MSITLLLYLDVTVGPVSKYLLEPRSIIVFVVDPCHLLLARASFVAAKQLVYQMPLVDLNRESFCNIFFCTCAMLMRSRW